MFKSLTRGLILHNLRGRWASQRSYVFVLIACSVGFGNVGMFTAKFYELGADAFLIPYVVCVIAFGIPTIAMECFMGQFTSNGSVSCWEFCPIFRGVGIGLSISLALLCFTYSNAIVWSVLYIFKSSYPPPWTRCDRQWATDRCLDFLPLYESKKCQDKGWTVGDDGACYNTSGLSKHMTALWNITLASGNNIKRILPAEEYLNNVVLGISKRGVGLSHLGQVHWDLVGCLFLVWLIMALTAVWGLKAMGLFMSYTIAFAFAALLALLIYGCTLDGAVDGMRQFLAPNTSNLFRTRVWVDVLYQVMYTLSINMALLPSLASVSNFNGNCGQHAVIVAVSNCLTSILIGLAIFAAVGSMAKRLGVSVKDIMEEKNAYVLMFAIYPYVLTELSGGVAWSVVLFLLLFCLGISTHISFMQALITTLLDLVPDLRLHRKPVLLLICFCYFLLGISMQTDGGNLLESAVSFAVSTWNLTVLSLLQNISLPWVYGIEHFLRDFEFMSGYRLSRCLPAGRVWKWYWAVCWGLLSPALLICSLVQQAFCADSNPYPYSTTYAKTFTMLITLSTLVPVPLLAVHCLLTNRGSLLERFRAAVQPTELWGPVHPKHRRQWLDQYKGTLAGMRTDHLAGDHQEGHVQYISDRSNGRNSIEEPQHLYGDTPISSLSPEVMIAISRPQIEQKPAPTVATEPDNVSDCCDPPLATASPDPNDDSS